MVLLLFLLLSGLTTRAPLPLPQALLPVLQDRAGLLQLGIADTLFKLRQAYSVRVHL